jgi:penicillin-binding protein 1C
VGARERLTRIGGALRKGLSPRVILARIRQIRWPQQPWKRGLLGFAGILVALAAFDLAFPPPLAKALDVSWVVLDRRGATLRAFPVQGGIWRLPARLDRIDPAFIKALLAYEDQRFYSHGGVDTVALVRAAGSSLSAGRIVSGGSTITMQTARLLEPRPRNIGSKIVESIRAIQLERRFSKKQILELYLTLAPYGGNLEGVRAASLAYFGREPDRLSPDQIALLIALPQSPEARRPDLRPKAAILARARVLRRLADEGVVAADLAAESADYPAPGRGAFPQLAWHASEEVIRQAPRRGEIQSTLDILLQNELEAIAARAALNAEGERGVQVAMLAVDIASRDVRAAVGSASRKELGGWLDLTNRARSPGSTLKPFVYGLAFDDGVATSGTRIADQPRRFASYRPSNFDRTFRGDVTVAEALQHSLNVPAVAALDAIGAQRFATALSFAGARVQIPHDGDDDAGLAIALGGLGLTVRDLTLLYAALGDDGRALPLVWIAQDPARRPPRAPPAAHILSEASAREIVRILAAAPAPDGRMPARLTRDAPVIAFKTGTSYGYRDAWAAGIGNGFAIVVWIGRADGAPRPGVTGRDAALPVLFEAFDAITRSLPASATAPGLRDAAEPEDAPRPLARLERDSAPPQILFPPHDSEVWFEDRGRGFVLAAEGRGRLSWYVDGAPIPRNVAGDPVWKPGVAGFYEVTVVDDAGRSSRSRVRVLDPAG